VLPVGKTYESERGTTVEVVRREGDQMSFERVYAPRTGHADPHYHADLTQTWECLEGEGRIEVDGAERALGTGDSVAIPPGTPHRDPWLPGDGSFKVRGSFDPCNAFIEGYAAAWVHHLQNGTANRQDEIPLLQIFAVARETDGRSFSAKLPEWLQRGSLPLVAAIARLRGYRASYDDV
jgi:hypothetical protein